MRALGRIRNIEAITGVSTGAYEIAYEYDEKERITKQVSTGSIDSETSYEYDEEDNIIKETNIDGDKKTTKVYGYNELAQVVSVTVIVENK